MQPNNNNDTSLLLQLPPEMLYNVLLNFYLKDLFLARRTNKQLRDFIEQYDMFNKWADKHLGKDKQIRNFLLQSFIERTGISIMSTDFDVYVSPLCRPNFVVGISGREMNSIITFANRYLLKSTERKLSYIKQENIENNQVRLNFGSNSKRRKKMLYIFLYNVLLNLDKEEFDLHPMAELQDPWALLLKYLFAFNDTIVFGRSNYGMILPYLSIHYNEDGERLFNVVSNETLALVQRGTLDTFVQFHAQVKRGELIVLDEASRSEGEEEALRMIQTKVCEI